MSFNYNKYKDKSHGDSFWTSYSDLFLGLSSIFLLLYVFSSLQMGTSGMKQQLENQNLRMKVAELQNQLKIYEQIKQDYLQNQASQNEVQEYTELMDKLTLLKEEARDEKERLKRAALENQSKEVALNKYQQMIRNVINSNKLAASKIINRDGVITEQVEEIKTQRQDISKLEKDIRHKKLMIEQVEKKIVENNQLLEKRSQELKHAYKRNQMTKKAYEHQMAKLKSDAEAKLQDLEDKNADYESQVASAQKQLGGLKRELSNTKGELGSVQNQLGSARENLQQAKAEASSLQGALYDAKGQLAKAKAEIDARKQIAREIKNAFGKAGVKAEVDMQSGEVVLDFGQAYFDNDSSRLKRDMRTILERAMPAYAHSLFGNPKISKKIASVEIIGFASPTYKGKFVDPKSPKPEDKQAIQYNMDLSYQRARSIFNHILDEETFQFEHQTDLVPLLKVSGRSFLETIKNNRNVASEDFCKVNDCKKAQKVIIRFNVNDKK